MGDHMVDAVVVIVARSLWRNDLWLSSVRPILCAVCACVSVLHYDTFLDLVGPVLGVHQDYIPNFLLRCIVCEL